MLVEINSQKDRHYHVRFLGSGARSSQGLAEKEKLLKKEGLWEEARETYLKKKNRYLSRQEENTRPSFVCYIEAVNEVFRNYRS